MNRLKHCITVSPTIWDRAREQAAKLGLSVSAYLSQLVARDTSK